MAIAEACGALHHRWGRIVDGNPQCEDCFQLLSEDSSNHCVLAEVPDYLNDLNAMKQAEDGLSDEDYGHFIDMLKCRYLAKTEGKTSDGCVSASASERAEDFLRAIGKWVES